MTTIHAEETVKVMHKHLSLKRLVLTFCFPGAEDIDLSEVYVAHLKTKLYQDIFEFLSCSYTSKIVAYI